MDKYSYFPGYELKCKCGCGQGQDEIDPLFMGDLIELRMDYDKPMRLSSAYRCPAYNNTISSTGLAGPHTIGAVDILVAGAEALELINKALGYGFTGIGLDQRGPHGSRFVHLDKLAAAPNRPRPWIWTY